MSPYKRKPDRRGFSERLAESIEWENDCGRDANFRFGSHEDKD